MSSSAPSLGRLLISHITLRGAEISQLYSYVAASGGASYQELAERFVPGWRSEDAFGIEEAALRESLNFLLIANLLQQEGQSRRRARFSANLNGTQSPFTLALLGAIRCLADERQRAISLVHTYLVVHDIAAISVAELRAELERSPYAKLFTWTSEKVLFWSQLAAFLGLIHRPSRSSQLIIAPSPSLLMQALSWASEGTESRQPLAHLLERIDASLFSCFTDRRRVHVGLANTLVAVHKKGRIRLSHSSDAMNSLLLGNWRVSDVELCLTWPELEEHA